MTNNNTCGDADCEGLDKCPCRPGVIRRELLMGMMPAFFVDVKSGRVCTHRMSDTDIPVWCRNSTNALDLMGLMMERADKT